MSPLHRALLRRLLARCETPACEHMRGPFAAPRHLHAQRCAAVDWWTGCAAWWAGTCACPGCAPEPIDGPGPTGCGCPPDEPAGLL